MKFIVTRSSFVNGKYIVASPMSPVVHECADDTASNHISRTWKPADKKAQAALAKLGVKADVTTLDEVTEVPPAPPAPDRLATAESGTI